MLDDLQIPARDGESVEVVIPESWLQGRAVFGGLVGAILVRAAGAVVAPDRVLRSLSVSFVGPVRQGPATVRAEVLRSGGTVTHVQAALLQAPADAADATRAAHPEQVLASALVAFGAPRPGDLTLPADSAPSAAGPEGIDEMPFIPGLTPDFTQHIAYRWTVESLPFTGSQAHVQGWIRPRDPGFVDTAMLVALLDAWPPPLLSAVERPIPISSLSWQVAVSGGFQPRPPEPDSWWLFDATSAFAADGYSDVEARLWDAQGHLLACSRQMYAYFSSGR